ncbi:MAG: class I SAM-dependent methyltransferase [Candidatus Eremiobacterota bacterium]
MTVFDTGAERYDAWFDTPEGRILFENELLAARPLWARVSPPRLEVGVGTGRFAQALGVEAGIDPAEGALRLARKRGILTLQGRGEDLPFPSGSLGGVLVMTTLCFARDAGALIAEAARVLRPEGNILIGEIEADSPWGYSIMRKKQEGHPFYREATLLSAERVADLLQRAGMRPIAFASTLLDSRPGEVKPEPPRMGLVQRAGFVCILAEKPQAAGSSG